MTRVVTLYRWRDRLYRVHVVTGLVAAAWFLLMALTGILINHQESLGLLDAEISDSYLPGYYRSDARTGTTRLNIIITDLHSGRILGSQGAWMSDLVAVLLIVSLLSGLGSNQMKKRLQAANSREIARTSNSSARREPGRDASNAANGSSAEDSEASSGKRVPTR
jgi:hypothetical protein